MRRWRSVLDFEPAWMGLAELYLRRERWPELEYFLQNLEGKGLNPAKVGWLRARGQVQRGEVAAARRTLGGVVAQDPRRSGPRVLLSQVLLQEGRDWAAAERALRDVLEIDPNHAETQHNLRVLLRRLGKESTTANWWIKAKQKSARSRTANHMVRGLRQGIHDKSARAMSFAGIFREKKG